MEAAQIHSTLGHRDLDLVERHRHGDPEAFAEVYERFQGMVYNLALRLVGPEEAADTAQEVFVRIYRALGRFAGRSSLKTWIYRITINRCRSRLRRRRPPLAPLSGETGEGGRPELADAGPGPEEDAIAEEAVRRLRLALAALPSPFREAVVLRDLEDMSYEEISAVLGVRLGTVRSRIARGRERLRQRLERGS